MDADGDGLEEAFSTAEDLVEGEKEKGKPERLLQRAISAVSSIDKKSPKLKADATQLLIQELIDKASSLLTIKS